MAYFPSGILIDSHQQDLTGIRMGCILLCTKKHIPEAVCGGAAGSVPFAPLHEDPGHEMLIQVPAQAQCLSDCWLLLRENC